MTGHSNFVRMTSYLHANSQASSQGQLIEAQRVTRICEDCEANFLKVLKERKIRKQGRKLTKKRPKGGGMRVGIVASQRSHVHKKEVAGCRQRNRRP